MTKQVYRMQVTACVCFDVEAGSEKEAENLAKKFMDEEVMGMDVAAREENDVRVYLDEYAKPEIVDISDKD